MDHKTSLTIHKDVIEKLNQFIINKKIPNIIFHGSNGCGKNTILSNFISSIYNNTRPIIKTHVMRVNCAYGRGIRFIREDLKYFAKSNLDTANGEMFKSIVLLNADKLTIDAQSALRRCIELFCHSTRFFIVVEDKNKLLKPILSRFCEIYVPDYIVNLKSTSKSKSKASNTHINLHAFHNENILGFKKYHTHRLNTLDKILKSNGVSFSNSNIENNLIPYTKLVDLSDSLVESGYSATDVIQLLENASHFNNEMSDDELFRNHELLLAFNCVKREFRNEKLLLLFVLYFIVFRSEMDLKNITFI
jgi:hypothetical protein